ncbi:uncharacterized protein ccdc142 isoform 2-T3 [Pholidichthys leucotaenia]
MDQTDPGPQRDPAGDPGLIADGETSEFFCPETQQRRSCGGPLDDLTSNGSRSQKSISRSLQRAETLLRTFNPGLRWLFQGLSQDEDQDQEDHMVVAHNLVSRSSSRLLRVQQTVLTVAPRWVLVGGSQLMGQQACFKGVSGEGGVLLMASSSTSFLQEHYRGLWRLLEQRSLLLFLHEFSRRTRLVAAFITRVNQLLENQLEENQRDHRQTSSWVRSGLSLLSQELRVHLSHWSCLLSKIQSDLHLRRALVQQTQLVETVRRTLDLLGLQALVLLDQYLFAVLCSVAQTPLESTPREVLEDIVAATDQYNQSVKEHQQRTAQLGHCPQLDRRLPWIRTHQNPSPFSLRELKLVLAAHHADQTAQKLYCWAQEDSHHVCPVHTCPHQSIGQLSTNDRVHMSSPWPEWTSLTSSPLFSTHTSVPWSDSRTVDIHCPLSKKDQISQCQTSVTQSCFLWNISETDLESRRPFKTCELLQMVPPPSSSSHCPPTRTSPSAVVHLDFSSAEVLLQVLLSSTDLLAPLVSHTLTPERTAGRTSDRTPEILPSAAVKVSAGGSDPVQNPADSVQLNRIRAQLTQNVEEIHEDQAEVELRPENAAAAVSTGPQIQADPDAEILDSGGRTVEPHSVQWLDLGRSVVLADLLRQYGSLLWSLCGRALLLQLRTPRGHATGSINLQNDYRVFWMLDWIREQTQTGQVPEESRTMMEDLGLNLLVTTAHACWDYEVCRCLGSSLRDKCLTDRPANVTTSRLGVPKSETMELLLLLPPPLLSSLSLHHSYNSSTEGSSSVLALRRQTVSLVLAWVQLSTVWVISKAYQFLSSWNLNKFLLITQGDLKVLRESLELMVQQTQTLLMDSERDGVSVLQNHDRVLLKQQLTEMDRVVCELQTFSSLVLKTFSSDCKRMSGEIFEQTMPSAVHWRPAHRTAFPSSPSEYACTAAQTVIGQVLEGVAPLSDDARVQALSITMTAFMEAWMEHILRHKIKFSVGGALQLKQDFDSIRDLILSERSGLSVDLHQRLLSLRVFQQVDSAVLCLLQQPQTKPYLRSRTWEPFAGCCPSSPHSAVGSSITNLRCEGLPQADHADVTPDLPPVDPSTPAEPYLAPSVSVGVEQQEWLNLRIQNGTRRWRLPGLTCLCKTEP